MIKEKVYAIIVVGGGHAGCEAALACARLKMKTCLITFHKDKIGSLSCNPAVGGLGKGQLVKEIDALGGEIAKATDACGIQFKILNASKGPAVWSSRAQVDMDKFGRYMLEVVEKQSNLEVLEDEVTDFIFKDKNVRGVITASGKKIKSKKVIAAPGTFLNGLMHVGLKSFPGGRLEEPETAVRLSESLKKLGHKILRFKTGTCARVDGRTIDFSKCAKQKGDKPPVPFSLSTKKLHVRQISCHITYTNEKTHKIIRDNLDRSPLFSGKITGTGVRYCPSLEDKVVKFPHHKRHQVFLEPEGKGTDEYYLNGLSTSLPEDAQDAFIRSVPGLKKVKINRFGYGIEHDAVDSRQLYPTLESKIVKNLYLAGQINGSTGYEEAAAQGLIAGINAALSIRKKTPLILDRASSYIGVLIDDLVTKGTNEPYRMLTSRVEYRLILREDNADLRLRKIGYKTGLVSREDYNKIIKKEKEIKDAFKKLKEIKIAAKSKKITLHQYLKRPEVKIEELKKKYKLKYSDEALRQVEIETKYEGFIKRQMAQVKAFEDIEKMKIPPELNYAKVPSLSGEIIEKLSHFKPLNLGQANRISGITPAAITILMIYLRKYKGEKKARV
ncbi:MAG: tRNA uridine-5-carboxymethylaminomethyl(34) synthesis enzyme MnmG [Candidatus Omnitrophica bacterium]|nr:tRNA uridine-5-carboxymethylaminomethyl(34) synthesis enzyme MnmG [Candidatus Omnitrophota bacterium]